MTTLPFYQVDAFTESAFHGNPAAVIILDSWLEDRILQYIAAENNLSETAFLVKKDEDYSIRWFTPAAEVELCGHATLASAHILFTYYEKSSSRLRFDTLFSGPLFVERDGARLTLDFPADPPEQVDMPESIVQGLRARPEAAFLGKTDYMFVFESQEQIEALDPDFRLLSSLRARGIICTAPGKNVDFVSRFFAPSIDIDEDPVTGSAHTTLTPYWAKRLKRNEFTALQLSARGGELFCRMDGNRVRISGNAVIVIEGKLMLQT